jgi:hypothetical protein
MWMKARLATGAVDGEGITDRRLDEKTIQDCSVIPVIIESIDQLRVAAGLFGVGAPDDALVQIGDPETVVLCVELEEQLIQAFGHVVDRAGIGGVEDFLGDFTSVRRLDADRQIAFRDCRTDCRIAIDAHGTEMDQMRIEVEFDQRIQKIVGGVDVVVDRVVLVAVAFHGIGRRTLLGEMDDCIRTMFSEPALEELVVPGKVDQMEVDAPAGLGMPDPGALLDGVHRGQRLDTELGIDPAAREVVEDMDLVAALGQVERCRPADKTVAAQDCYLHDGVSAGFWNIS